MLFKNGQNLLQQIQRFIENSERLLIIVPFIKGDALEELLHYRRVPTEIIVRWQLKDILTGASDLEIYHICQKSAIPLYRNPRIHLKCFINNFEECLITSANISKRAMSNRTEADFNHEVGTTVNKLSFEDRIYFQSILNESALVTPETIEIIRSVLEKEDWIGPSVSDSQLGDLHPDKDFLLSALPMSESVEILNRIYLDKKAHNTTDYNCAIHDLVLYHIEEGLKEQAFLAQLKTNFFSHPFIQAFLTEVERHGGAVHFGFVRKWIKNNCTNVPLPRAWEVTTNVQILFRWIVKLGDGKYRVDIPGKHSERLYRLE